jgi:hypothetical protein
MTTIRKVAGVPMLATAFLLVCGSAGIANQAIAKRNDPLAANINLPLDWYPAFDAAVREFVASERPSKGCFTASAQVRVKTLSVSFSPRRGPGDENLRGGVTGCGRAVSYEMAGNGEIIRKSFSR